MTVIETHFARVLLTRTSAYKLKKPVRRGRMDYRSIRRRRQGCLAEVRLNRRLAPEVYLGVLALRRRANGRLTFDSDGRVVDWIIWMRRLPAGGMLDRRIAAGIALTVRERRALVAMFASFYAKARAQPMPAARYLRSIDQDLVRTAQALCAPRLRMDRAAVRATLMLQRRFLASHRSMLGARARRLVEAHGDLRPEHVFLGSPRTPPCVIDCLEFDAALRRLDPAEELSFLALECGRLGAHALGRAILRSIQRSLGDPVPGPLLDFYESRRALIRARLAAWRLHEPGAAGERLRWRSRAHAYVLEAQRLACRALAAARTVRTNTDARSATRTHTPMQGAGSTPAGRGIHGHRIIVQEGPPDRARAR